jgi:hypothetical protein
MRKRRESDPIGAMLARAQHRASKAGMPFTLQRSDFVLPTRCPVLGIPLQVTDSRKAGSPSLDRVCPSLGYVAGNVRVISDRANRLKGDRGSAELAHLAAHGKRELRPEYGMVLLYVERETLLAEVRERAARGGRLGQEWEKVAKFLERVFSGRTADIPRA